MSGRRETAGIKEINPNFIQVNPHSKIFCKKVNQNWKDKEKIERAAIFLKNFFPNTEIPNYDNYFRFPKGSLVCIKQSTADEFLIDCYSNRISNCTMDFSLLLRRIASIGNHTFDTIGFETERTSFRIAFIDALLAGGILFFIIPPIIECVVQNSYNRVVFYIVIASIYTLIYTIYGIFWRYAK